MNRPAIVSAHQRRASTLETVRLALRVLGAMLVAYFLAVGALSSAVAWGWAA